MKILITNNDAYYMLNKRLTLQVDIPLSKKKQGALWFRPHIFDDDYQLAGKVERNGGMQKKLFSSEKDA